MASLGDEQLGAVEQVVAVGALWMIAEAEAKDGRRQISSGAVANALVDSFSLLCLKGSKGLKIVSWRLETTHAFFRVFLWGPEPRQVVSIRTAK